MFRSSAVSPYPLLCCVCCTFLVIDEILSYMYIGIHVKCLFFLPEFNQKWIVSTNFGKNPQ
jgi:hypothetical protein